MNRFLVRRSSRGDEALIPFTFRTLDVGLWTLDFRLPRLWHRATPGINPLVDRAAAQRIRTLDKNPFDEFVVKKSLTVNELIEHPRRNPVICDLRFAICDFGSSRWHFQRRGHQRLFALLSASLSSSTEERAGVRSRFLFA